MKFVLALLGLSQAVQIKGIPKGDIMQNQPNHWRKIWPQGLTDDGRDDDKILFGWSIREPEEDKRVKYAPVVLDSDVITTLDSVKTVEGKLKTQLGDDTLKVRGFNRIDGPYDNLKTVWERNTPYGNDWHKWDWENNTYRTTTEPTITSPPPDGPLAPHVDPPAV